MTGEQVSLEAAEAFYRACLIGIRYMRDCPQGRRGSATNLKAIDKTPTSDLTEWLEILLTQAAAAWGPAFSPARVFRFSGLAAEEPFGPNWPVLPKKVSEELLEESEGYRFQDCTQALSAVAAAWSLALQEMEGSSLELAPKTGLLVAGPSAIAAAVELFKERDDLDWGKQVVVVARRPDTRHLAGLAGLFLNSRAATRLISPDEAPSGARSPAYAVFTTGHIGADEVLISKDAEPLAADFARGAKEGV